MEGVKIDIWETDSKGFYDVQYPGREGPDQRAVMKSDGEGVFWFKAIVPVPYPIPHDGPVGKLLKMLKRHCFRPSHMHFMFEKEGYDHLITYVSPKVQVVSSLLTLLAEHCISATTPTKPQTPSSALRNHY